MSTVYWLTGLSGAGKTTIGRQLRQSLSAKGIAAVLLDGDTLRDVFGGVFGYSRDERLKCALCYSRLCGLLSAQGITVVCCTISMFDSVREYNREHIPGYVEVYIKASLETLRERDQKGLYSGVEAGSEFDVMGVDMHMEEPKSPDIILENDGFPPVSECVNIILNWSANK